MSANNLWGKTSVCVCAGILAIFLGTTGTVRAAEWYVATNGNGSAGTSWDTAFTNVQTALDVAVSNDTVYLAGQTFLLTNQLSWTTSGIILRGGYEANTSGDSPGAHDPAQWPTVIKRSGVPDTRHRIFSIIGVMAGKLEHVRLSGGYLGGPGGCIRIENCTNLLLTDCVIANSSLYDGSSTGEELVSYGGGIYVANSLDVRLDQCVVSNNYAVGTSAAGGGIYATASSVSLSQSVVQGNTTVGTWVADSDNSGGIWSSGRLMLNDCKIINNKATRGTYGGYTRGGGLCLLGESAILRNVLIAGNHSDRNAGDGLYAAAQKVVLLNCTVADNGGQGIARGSGTVSATNCIVSGNWDDIVGTVGLVGSLIGDGDNVGTNGCIEGDPLFEYGYYLATQSPCVDAGSGSASSWDLSGDTTCTDGSGDTGTVDMGYHYPTGFDLSYADLYVATDGNDVNSGTTAAQPLQTVTKALTLARDGTRIHVATGTYSQASGEVFPLTISEITGLSILGGDASRTTLNASGADQRVMGLSMVHRFQLTGLTLTGGRTEYGAGIHIRYCRSASLSDCVICTNSATGLNGRGGGIDAAASDVTLSTCVVQGNTANGWWGNACDNSGGIWSSGRLMLSDCRIVNNRATSGPQGGVCRGGGLCLLGESAILRNVLIAGNHSDRNAGDGLYAAAQKVVLLNCTVADNGGQGIARGSGTVSATNCIVSGNWDDIVGTVGLDGSLIGDGDNVGTNGCIAGDPLFEYGYYLATQSPCVGAGSGSASSWGLSDTTTRTDGSGDTGTVDMGYHYPTGFDLSYADLYVATDGNDANSGTTAAQPLQTVTKALTLARDGTRIHVATGTYSQASGEVFPLTISEITGLSILGGDASRTTLSASGVNQRVMGVNMADQFHLAGLTLTGGRTEYGAGIHIRYCQSASFSDCVICTNSATGANGRGGGIDAEASDVTLSTCVVQGNTAYGSWGNGCDNSGGIWSSGRLMLSDCRIVNNRATRGAQGGVCRGGGLCLLGESAILRNVLIAGNHSDRNAGDGLYAAAQKVVLLNCTVVDNAGQGIAQGSGTVSATNSIVWGNGDDIVGTVTLGASNIEDGDQAGTNGNISADPLFVNVSAGDYRLQLGSPSVNTGLLQDWMAGAVDLDGKPRVSMGKVDMGCYEHPAPAGTLFLVR